MKTMKGDKGLCRFHGSGFLLTSSQAARVFQLCSDGSAKASGILSQVGKSGISHVFMESWASLFVV